MTEKLSKNPYKGTRDFLPKDYLEREYLFEKMHHSARAFGFLPYDGPLLESLELYRAKSGEEIVNTQLYSFTDRGGREVAIRPEMTPTLARMASKICREYPLPLKWYSIPNLYRYENPQRGRVREHWQWNCDILGQNLTSAASEILQLLLFFFESLGANSSHVKIYLNHRKLISFLCEKILGLSPSLHLPFFKLLDRSAKISPHEFREQLISLISNKDLIPLVERYLTCHSFEEAKTFFKQYQEGEEAFRDLENVLSSLPSYMGHYLEFGPSIVRGLDYYTGIVFEAFDQSPENPRAICGGGAYENLLGLFGESLEGIGLGLGDVTLANFLETHQLWPNLKCPNITLSCFSQEPLTFSQERLIYEILYYLRKKSFCAVWKPTPLKIKKGLQWALQNNSTHCLFIHSSTEEDAKTKDFLFSVKNLSTQQQQDFSLTTLNSSTEKSLLDFLLRPQQG